MKTFILRLINSFINDGFTLYGRCAEIYLLNQRQRQRNNYSIDNIGFIEMHKEGYSLDEMYNTLCCFLTCDDVKLFVVEHTQKGIHVVSYDHLGNLICNIVLLSLPFDVTRCQYSKVVLSYSKKDKWLVQIPGNRSTCYNLTSKSYLLGKIRDHLSEGHPIYE